MDPAVIDRNRLAHEVMERMPDERSRLDDSDMDARHQKLRKLMGDVIATLRALRIGAQVEDIRTRHDRVRPSPAGTTSPPRLRLNLNIPRENVFRHGDREHLAIEPSGVSAVALVDLSKNEDDPGHSRDLEVRFDRIGNAWVGPWLPMEDRFQDAAAYLVEVIVGELYAPK